MLVSQHLLLCVVQPKALSEKSLVETPWTLRLPKDVLRLPVKRKQLVQQVLDRYKTGINIKAVEAQNAQPPSQVKSAFDDAVKAREDQVQSEK